MAAPSSPRKRVRGYFRKDGTYVPGHYRSRPAPSQRPRSDKEGSSIGGLIVLVLILMAIGYLFA